MEKDIGKIKKNAETDIMVRVDDFGGKTGITIREYTHSEKYTGFTKSGTRIPLESFDEFKSMINSIKAEDLKDNKQNSLSTSHSIKQPTPKEEKQEDSSSEEDYI